jgi:hypothetical protein
MAGFVTVAIFLQRSRYNGSIVSLSAVVLADNSRDTRYNLAETADSTFFHAQ